MSTHEATSPRTGRPNGSNHDGRTIGSGYDCQLLRHAIRVELTVVAEHDAAMRLLCSLSPRPPQWARDAVAAAYAAVVAAEADIEEIAARWPGVAIRTVEVRS